MPSTNAQTAARHGGELSTYTVQVHRTRHTPGVKRTSQPAAVLLCPAIVLQ